MASDEWQDKALVYQRAATIVTVSVLFTLSMACGSAIAQQAPSSADQSNRLCNSDETFCVSKTLEHAQISAPIALVVQFTAAQKVEVAWEVRDASDKTLASGTSREVDTDASGAPLSSKAFIIRESLLQVAATREGTLVLAPSAIDASGKKELPRLEVPVELNTETTTLTIVAPEDTEKYLAEVHASVDSGDEVFSPKTPLVPQSVTVMKLLPEVGAFHADDRLENTGIAGATAEAVLLRWPGQGPWRVFGVHVDGGVARVMISSTATETVSYYATAVSYLIQMSLLRLPGIQQVVIELPGT